MKLELPSLKDEEIDFAQQKITRSPSGMHRLRDIFGVDWNRMKKKNDYGIRFKQSARDGRLRGIKIGPVTSQNHQTYWIAG
ncbi:hypothetical protein V6U71_05660 [Sphingopyxis sp. J-6]|uniref:hypothetical protein n=1 Tax=Sphingopyxis sp. J-6 TaxID=3122054 RepID=UPI0039840B62